MPRDYIFKDLTGLIFSRLTVLERVESRKGSAYWKCKCICGNITIKRGKNLTCFKNVQSCGCLHKENFKRKPKYASNNFRSGGQNISPLRSN